MSNANETEIFKDEFGKEYHPHEVWMFYNYPENYRVEGELFMGRSLSGIVFKRTLEDGTTQFSKEYSTIAPEDTTSDQLHDVFQSDLKKQLMRDYPGTIVI